MSKLRLLATLVASIIAVPAYAGSCPSPVSTALRLVMVTTRSMNVSYARMQLFTRTSADTPWSRAGRVEPVVVGKAGLGWGYTFLRFRRDGEFEKVEGDKRTPAGFFRIGASFGFSNSNLGGHVVLKAKETVCVEDPVSPFYNTVRKRAEIGPTTQADDMRSTSLYRNGLFIDYPSDRATRRGSCILIHIWQAPDMGTAGCVAMPEVSVRALQEFSQPGAVLAVLPEDALDRFTGCLPNLLPVSPPM